MTSGLPFTIGPFPVLERVLFRVAFASVKMSVCQRHPALTERTSRVRATRLGLAQGTRHGRETLHHGLRLSLGPVCRKAFVDWHTSPERLLVPRGTLVMHLENGERHHVCPRDYLYYPGDMVPGQHLSSLIGFEESARSGMVRELGVDGLLDAEDRLLVGGISGHEALFHWRQGCRRARRHVW